MPTDRARAPTVLSPFDVVGAFRVALWLAVDDYEIGLQAPVCGQHDRAIPHAIADFDAFGEIDFFRLGDGQGRHPRFNSESA